jgi:hypothetical protein
MACLRHLFELWLEPARVHAIDLVKIDVNHRSDVECKRPTNRALAVHCRAWEVCSVIGKLVSTHDDGYGFGWPGAPAAMDEL